MSRSVNTWSYRPGGWLAIFGAATTLLLPDSEKQRAAQLWELVDSGAGFDATLDQVLAPGLSVLPAFVLIGTGDGPTKVIVRGAGVRARLTTDGETVDLDGSTVTTWVERTLDGVTALSVTVGGDASDDAVDADLPDHLIQGGLVRVCRVDHPPRVAPVVPEQAVAEAPVPVAVPVPVPVPMAPSTSGEDLPEDGAEDEPGDGPGDGPEVGAVPAAALGTEVDEDGAATELFSLDEPAPLEEPSPLDDEADTSSVAPPRFDPLSDGLPDPDAPGRDAADPEASGMVWAPDTPAVPPMFPPVPPAPSTTAAPDPAPAVDHDGMTRAGVPGDDSAPTPPGIPGQPQAPSVTRPVAVLVISNGESIEVDRVVLVGRAPEARRFTATEQPRLVTVPSPLHEISSTHVEVRPGSGVDHGSAVVTDMGSTNGTVLVQPGLDPEELQPGIAVQLIPGAIINLGDGVTIQVMNP